MEDYVSALKRIKKEPVKKNKKTKLITKLLLSIIFIFSSLIFMKTNPNNKSLYEKYFYEDNFSFTKVNNWYNKYFGTIMPSKKTESLVSSEVNILANPTDYLDGESFKVGKGTPVKNITSGIVVFLGDKEGYGKTIVIEGVDGTNIWYGNLTDIGVNLYDYIETNTLLGNAASDNIYLVIKKDNANLKYEQYKN